MKHLIFSLMLIAVPVWADYLGTVTFGDTLILSAVTHNATGESVNADESPTFKIFASWGGPLVEDQYDEVGNEVTGAYFYGLTINEGGSFDEGGYYYVISSATVDGVEGKKTDAFSVRGLATLSTVESATVELLAEIQAIELDTSGLATLESIESASTEILAEIGGLNDLSAAQVWTHGTRELTDLDLSELDLSGLDIPSATENAAAVLAAEVEDASGTVSEILRNLRAWSIGRFTVEEGAFTYYAPDGVTELFTFTLSDEGRE